MNVTAKECRDAAEDLWNKHSLVRVTKRAADLLTRLANDLDAPSESTFAVGDGVVIRSRPPGSGDDVMVGRTATISKVTSTSYPYEIIDDHGTLWWCDDENIAPAPPELLPVGTVVRVVEDGAIGTITSIKTYHDGDHYELQIKDYRDHGYSRNAITPYIPPYLMYDHQINPTTGEYKVCDGVLYVEYDCAAPGITSKHYWPLADCTWLVLDPNMQGGK